jgi:lysozyme
MNKFTLPLVVILLLIIHACHDMKQGENNVVASDSAGVVSAPVDSHQQTIPQQDSNVSNQAVLGIDVSHFQQKINWEEIMQAGLRFAYYKATQGVSSTDPNYQNNRSGAEASGIYNGAYHFYMAADDPVKQAQHFLSHLMPLKPGQLPPVLDIEQGSVTSSTQKDKLMKDVLTWLSIVEQKSGIRPIIYTNHPFGDEYLRHADFSNYHLWIAEYGVAKPKIPFAWTKKGWLMWQRTERGKIEGAVGNVDHDILNGDIEILKKLAVNK